MIYTTVLWLRWNENLNNWESENQDSTVLTIPHVRLHGVTTQKCITTFPSVIVNSVATQKWVWTLPPIALHSVTAAIYQDCMVLQFRLNSDFVFTTRNR
jgi:hypothetical protein